MKPKLHLALCVAMFSIVHIACIPPQDCELINREITGQVQDQNDNPISGATVKLDSLHHEYGKDGIVNESLLTDDLGHFKQSVSVYRCDSVKFVVSRDGYSEYNVTYGIDPDMAFNSGWMPNNLVITLVKAR